MVDPLNNPLKKRITRLIAEIDPDELACRILEGAMSLKRPNGVTALQALSELNDDARTGMYRAAENAAKYISQCIDNGRMPS